MSTERSLQFGQMKYGIARSLAAQPEESLKPALAAEVPDLEHRRDGDQPPRPRVAEVPAELGHVAEVLAVEADDEGRDEQDRRDRGQPLHHLVLVVRDLRLVVVPDSGDEVA